MDSMGRGLPPLAWQVFLIGWPDWPVVAFCLLAVLLYLGGVYRLRRRGDRWPAGRTAFWLIGIGIIYLSSGSGFYRYAMVMFSAHMAQHMILNMYAPLLLVRAAPVTLALRALPAGRGRWSGRGILLRMIHSRVLQFFSTMPVALVLFVISLYVLYFTPLFSMLMSTTLGHLVMQVHFMLSGYLFFWTVVGADPGPRRPSILIRLATLLPVNAAHAFFAVIVAFSNVLLGQPYLGRVSPSWVSLRTDQATGGGIAGGMAEAAILVPATVLLLQWFRRMQRRDHGPVVGLDSDFQLPQDSRP